MYCGKAGYRPSTCTVILCPVLISICEQFDKLTKLVTYRRYLDRRNLSVDLYYRDHLYSTCVT